MTNARDMTDFELGGWITTYRLRITNALAGNYHFEGDNFDPSTAYNRIVKLNDAVNFRGWDDSMRIVMPQKFRLMAWKAAESTYQVKMDCDRCGATIVNVFKCRKCGIFICEACHQPSIDGCHDWDVECKGGCKNA